MKYRRGKKGKKKTWPKIKKEEEEEQGGIQNSSEGKGTKRKRLRTRGENPKNISDRPQPFFILPNLSIRKTNAEFHQYDHLWTLKHYFLSFTFFMFENKLWLFFLCYLFHIKRINNDFKLFFSSFSCQSINYDLKYFFFFMFENKLIWILFRAFWFS